MKVNKSLVPNDRGLSLVCYAWTLQKNGLNFSTDYNIIYVDLQQIQMVNIGFYWQKKQDLIKNRKKKKLNGTYDIDIRNLIQIKFEMRGR